MVRQKQNSNSSCKGEGLRKRTKPTSCPHVALTGQFGKDAICTSYECYSCKDTTEAKWICLHADCCKDIKTGAFCGIKDRSHHITHKEDNSDHIVFLHALNHRLYCFECDIEISRDYNIPEIPSALRRCLLKRGRQVSQERDSSPGKKLVIKESPKATNILVEVNKARGAPLENDASCGRPIMKQMEDEFENDYPKGLTGLRNLVNTCYFNAAVQVLSNCPPFSDFFRDKGDLRPYSFNEPIVSSYLSMTIQKLWSHKRELAISPELLLHGVRERFPQFRGWAQQDAQELIRCLLEQIHKEMGQPIYRYETVPSGLLVKKGRRHSSTSSGDSDHFETADSGWSSDGDTPSTSNDSRTERKTREAEEKKNREPIGWRSIVTDVFDGTIESCVKCLTCKTVSKTAETFQDLSLPIPTKEQLNKLTEFPVDDEHFSSMGGEREGVWSWWTWLSSLFVTPPISLHDCLSAFFSPDRLVGDDMYSCDKCKKLRNGVKTCRIEKSPEVLSIHLKRFRHDTFSSSKISTRVSFPLCDLDISPFCSPDEKNTIYDLCGFISHEGSSMDCGHYLAYCKNEIDGNWYEYDDSTVTKLDTAYVMTKEAYVLFYQKRNDPLIEDIRREVAHAVSPTAHIKVTSRTYISSEWLLKLNTFADPGTISNFSFLCQHGHILPRRANHITTLCTTIPTNLAEKLYSEFGGGPRVDKLHYCLICNKRWQWLYEKKNSERARYKEIDEAIRAALYTDDSILYITYLDPNLINKSWLQTWERFVSDPIAEPPGPIDNSSLLMTNDQGETMLIPKSNYSRIPRELYLFFVNCYSGGPEVFLTLSPQPTEEELKQIIKEADTKIEEAKTEATKRLQSSTDEQVMSSL